MEYLQGQTLHRKNQEEVPSDEALKDKEIIGLYFSAHWCPPCKMFTPVLADFYEELNEANEPFEIIFISSDHSPEALFDYMNQSHGNWLAAPHRAPFAELIRNKFGIRGIPTLIIIKKDGTLITENGRRDVETKGARAFKDWKM